MENISKKRGRPRAFDSDTELLTGALGLFDDSRSRRGKVDTMYRQRALASIMHADNPERFAWLVDQQAIAAGTGKLKKAILIELGRVDSVDTLLTLAAHVCDTRMKTREAVALVRRVRLGVSDEGDAGRLAIRIVAAVRGYLAEFPQTTAKQVRDALDMAATCVR